MNRRAILAAVGTLAISPVRTAAGKSDESDGIDTECDTVEITTGSAGTTDEVPAPWWEQVQRARDVQDELEDDFGAEPWFEGTGRSSGSETICGQNALIVTVYTSNEEAARTRLDATRNGVRIYVDDPTKTGPDDLDGDVLEGTPTADPETDSTDDGSDPTPGLGVLGAIVSLGTARYLLAGRQRGEDRS